jgi:hypothetical protein
VDADSLHLWINGKPVNSKKMVEHEQMKLSVAKHAAQERSEKIHTNEL